MWIFLACSPPEPTRCNGSELLCDKAIDQSTVLGTHNSMASTDAGFLPPNHNYGIPQQLRDGVRGLNLDTYWSDDQAMLCHGFCELGQQPLVDALSDVKDFLTEQPDSVIIITFQATISAEQTVAAFEQAELASEMYEHPLGTAWPSLITLIENQQRLIVFASNDGGTVPGYMDQWTHWIDNPYSANDPGDFSCAPDRGNLETASLYNLNHFLTNPIASQSSAEDANQLSVLSAHVDECQRAWERKPNQILVDFYSIGAGQAVVASLNE